MKSPAPDEHRLIELAKCDPTSFGELYERYVGRIYSYVYYRTGNEHDAEDLTARVFFRALKRLPSYSDRGLPFSAWLYRIAHNLVANWHRDQGRRKIVPLDEYVVNGIQSEAPEYAAESREEQEFLLDIIRQLPAERQQLLILKFVEHMSNAEIGAVLNRSEGAIKSLYHRTLLTLRDDLERRTGRPLPPPNGH
ncbi:MAG: sigma-70 family RNA polymerase sigma factor [Chloroflexi bacterium]|nr:sigma-70 family RNA polymerase sigma factor [Chloroflexota bacterium]